VKASSTANLQAVKQQRKLVEALEARVTSCDPTEFRFVKSALVLARGVLKTLEGIDVKAGIR
jgi:hypothetical protein